MRIWTVSRHSVPCLCEANDRGLERDIVAGESVGVAHAIPAFVVVPDGRNRPAKRRKLRDYLCSSRHVLAHQFLLIAGEQVVLREDRVRHAYLSDVVEERRRGEHFEPILRQTERRPYRERHSAYSLRMACRVGIPRLNRGIQRLEGVEQCLLEFRDPLQFLDPFLVAIPPSHKALIGTAGAEF